MGASSSSDQKTQEQQELESLATSTGALPILQKSFSNLSDPQSNSIPIQSLQDCFSLNFTNPTSKGSSVPECFDKLLSNLGQTIVKLFFIVDDKDGINWIEFLRGYIKCCGRMSSSVSLNTLYRLYASTTSKAGFPSKLEFESVDDDYKISGCFMPNDVLFLLWICWTMSFSSEISKNQIELDLPDITHLILSAITSCTEVSKDIDIWNCSISDLEVQLPAQKLHTWALTETPGLGHCFTQYVHDRLQRCTISEEGKNSSLPVGDSSSKESPNMGLLTCGRAWAISLTLTSSLREEVLKASIPRDGVEELESLLYRSSIHGRGLSRFWSNVDGYHGPLLLLISASSIESSDVDSSSGRWVIGVVTGQGFENKDDFYGTSGYLYAISPIFHIFPPHGRDKNFVYSHLHPSGRYEARPKPVGIAFGGTSGNERIFIDEDFAKITTRHHAVDKTYRHGSLFPNQGYLPSEASILEVEVWGLGGEKFKQMQDSHMKREKLFTEQRRKVDLKTLGNWEDSPERMMMDMVSDPNRPQREER